MITFRCRSQRVLLAVASLVGVLVLASSARAAPNYAIEVTKSKTIKATYSFEVDTPKLTANEWIIFAPAAPNLVCQSDTRTRLVPDGAPYTELSPRARSILRARVSANDASLKNAFRGRLEVHATLYARKLVERTAGGKYATVEPLSPAERQASLAETSMLDLSNEKFQAWIKEHKLARKRNEDELAFGLRVFLDIRRSFGYEYREEMDRHASHVCQAGKSDCGGLSGLFVATMRASNVPARILFGRWAKSAESGGTLEGVPYYQQHVKAEFYASGVGWVPVDLSSAVLYDKTREGMRYFGNDRGDFVVLHVDPDMTVDSVHFGKKPLRLLQGFHYFVTGKGTLEQTAFKQNWTVE
jgi:transglutaminase-like putative cysteine protease